MAVPATSSDSVNVNSFIGSHICLITKSEIRYEGFIFHLDPNASTVGLRNVKSFGTEGRRKDGPQVSPSERIYDFIYFRGSNIKDLQVLATPSSQCTSALPDDPAIIQPRHPLPPATISLASHSASQATAPSYDAQSGFQTPTFQGNLPQNRSPEVSVPFASAASSPPPITAMPNNQFGFAQLPGETSFFQQQPFPPLPQGLLLTNPIQRPVRRTNMNAPLAGSSLNVTDASRPLLRPVCTGSLTSLPTVPPPSSMQSRMVNPSSQTMSFSASSSNVNPVVPPDTQKGQSLLGPAPFPIFSKSVLSTEGTSHASHGKTSITSRASMHKNSQLGFVESSASLEERNDDLKIISESTFDPQPSDSEDTASQLLEPVTLKLHEPSSLSRYANRLNVQDQRDARNRGRAQGRGQGNPPNRAAMYSNHSHRGHPVRRENVITGAPLYPHYPPSHPVRGNGPNTTRYHRHYGGGHARVGSKVSSSATRFTEDFDFEAMNQKFNKEELWGLFGKSKLAEAQDKEGKDMDGDTSSDEQVKARDGCPKLDQPVYCKDDFFDSFSCHSLGVESGRGKIKLSEQRKIDAETFGQIPKHRYRGILGRQRGGSFRGSYRGRGAGNAGRGRTPTYWNCVA